MYIYIDTHIGKQSHHCSVEMLISPVFVLVPWSRHREATKQNSETFDMPKNKCGEVGNLNKETRKSCSKKSGTVLNEHVVLSLNVR